jgi:hypothetical protein
MEPIYNLGIRQDCIVVFMRNLFTEHHKRYYFLLKHNELTIEDVDNYNDRLEYVLIDV